MLHVVLAGSALTGAHSASEHSCGSLAMHTRSEYLSQLVGRPSTVGLKGGAAIWTLAVVRATEGEVATVTVGALQIEDCE